MFTTKICYTLFFASMLAMPTMGQFGVAGNRKQGQQTQFQELQELAKKQATGGGGGGMGGGDDDDIGMADLEKMMAGLMDDTTMEQLKQYGDQFGGVLEQMMKMSPEELQKQMEDAMKLMTQGDLVDTILTQKEEVLKTLEASGTVPPEELAKYKADPEYFELKMRESFDQMKDIFSNPDYLSKATEAMQNMKSYMNDPSKMAELTKTLGSEFSSDEKIEEARIQILNGELSGIPGMAELFDSEEMQALLQDPIKWKETVKDGFEDLLNLGVTGGISDTAANPTGTPTTINYNDEL